MKQKNEDYIFRSVFNETFETVTFYIKSKRFDDEFGIIIYPNGSFYPIISVAHLYNSDADKRKEAIEKFIVSNLGVSININDDSLFIEVEGLYEKAKCFSKENSLVEYTDENGDIYLYKDGQSGVTTIKGIGKI